MIFMGFVRICFVVDSQSMAIEKIGLLNHTVILRGCYIQKGAALILYVLIKFFYDVRLISHPVEFKHV